MTDFIGMTMFINKSRPSDRGEVTEDEE